MPQNRKPEARRQGHRTAAVVPMLRDDSKLVPPAPPGILKLARERWETFWLSDVSRAIDPMSDLPRLHRWIGDTDEYDRLVKAFRKTPLVKGSTGQPVMNPIAGRLAQLESAISKAEAEFGMTPLSRMRLGIATGEAARSLADLNASILDQHDDTDDDGDTRLVVLP